MKFIRFLLPALLLGSQALLSAPAAGILEGTVESIHSGGRFFDVKVAATEPIDLAPVGDSVKIMANWGPKEGGGMAPKTEDTRRILGYSVGESVTIPVRRDRKQNEAFRFTSEENIEKIQERARKIAETMFIPEAPTPVDPSKIKGANVDKLEELARGRLEEISVAPGDSLQDALERAAELQSEGKAVRLSLAAGTYPMKDFKTVKFGGGQGKPPLLMIIGAGSEQTVIDFEDTHRKAKELVYINDKHHLVLSGFAMVNHPDVPLLVGRYSPMQDNRDFLFTDLRFDRNYIGLTLFHVDGLTIRNMQANENKRTGLFLLCRNAIVEDSQFNGNRGAGPGSFRGGIALAALDTLIRNVECNDNPEGASGIRMDHSAENVILENVQMNRNGKSGSIWETAKGPVLIRDSQMNQNNDAGIVLATAYNFAIIDSEIRNNDSMQIEVSTKPRPIAFIGPGKKDGAYGASDFSVVPGEHPFNLVGMMGNRFLTIRGTTIETGNEAEHPFIGHKYGKPDIYKTYFTEQYVGENNHFFSPSDGTAFDRFQGAEYSAFDLIDLPAWQGFTGQDRDSSWEKRTALRVR